MILWWDPTFSSCVFFTGSLTSAFSSAPNLRLCSCDMIAPSTTFHSLCGAHQLSSALFLQVPTCLENHMKTPPKQRLCTFVFLLPFYSSFPSLLLFSKSFSLNWKKSARHLLGSKVLLKQNVWKLVQILHAQSNALLFEGAKGRWARRTWKEIFSIIGRCKTAEHFFFWYSFICKKEECPLSALLVRILSSGFDTY